MADKAERGRLILGLALPKKDKPEHEGKEPDGLSITKDLLAALKADSAERAYEALEALMVHKPGKCAGCGGK